MRELITKFNKKEMNKDITEWLLDEGIEPLCEIVNSKNETIFLSDLLEKHLTEQLNIHSVVGRSEQLKNFTCLSIYDGFAPCKTQCEECKNK